MISLSEEFPSGIVESVGKYPVRRSVGDGVSDPLDMVRELTPASGMIVLRIYEAFDEVLGLPVDDERRRRRLFAIGKGV